MSSRSLVLGLGASLGLAGCYDVYGELQVYNHTGQTIVLNRVKAIQYGTKSKPLALADGGRARVHLAIERGPLKVSAGGCEYAYRFAPMRMNLPFGDYDYPYPVSAQIEPDFSIHLLPHGATKASPTEELGAASRPGFPLKPVDRTCR